MRSKPHLGLLIPFCLLLMASWCHSLTPSLKSMSLEELAELFARSPIGKGFTMSPDGDRLFAYVHRNGETGLVVVEL